MIFEKKSCGIIIRGINCIIWNFDFVKVDKRILKVSVIRVSIILIIIIFNRFLIILIFNN